MDTEQESHQGGRGRGGVGRGGGRRRRPDGVLEFGYVDSARNLSREGYETLMRVIRRRGMRLNWRPGVSVAVFDNGYCRYSWLLRGWIAEERLMPSGRIYRYYYDPVGQMYNTRDQVITIYEDLGLILLED